MALALFGILLSLIVLITFAYRGHSVIVVAPIAALIAIIFSGAPILASYTQVFMPALAGFITDFFPLFITGAIFGKLMSLSGYAADIARWISRLLGPNQAILVTILATALMTYGGVAAWVVVFTIFPIAKSLFKEADIPKRLMPAAIASGIFTFATAALPGSPQLHNTIPTGFFGTDTFAAPILGIIGALFVFGLSLAWLNWRRRKLREAGESFSDPTEEERRTAEKYGPETVASTNRGSSAPPQEEREETSGQPLIVRNPELPEPQASVTLTKPKGIAWRGLLGLLPVVTVVAVNALMTYVVLPAMDTEYLATEQFGETSLSSVAGLWSVTTGMVAGIAVIFLLNVKNIREYISGLSEGAKNAVIPAFTTASEVGYGGVIASLAAFAVISDAIFGISDNALITSILATSGIAAVTGSASGGLTISLEAFGDELALLATNQEISMEVMHRATAMAATGLDSLPHNGAIITLLLVCGLTHRESYKDIGVVTVIVPVVGIGIVATLGLMFGGF